MLQKLLGPAAAFTFSLFVLVGVGGAMSLDDPTAGPGAVPRAAKNLVHVANVCGFVGTDIEFQSRTDSAGKVHDYAFVGTMGAGMRIYDITKPVLNPLDPTSGVHFAGAYTDPGWQDDVQVSGNFASIGFDPVTVGINVSTCIRSKNPSGSVTRGGIDIVDLNFSPTNAATGILPAFAPTLRDCYLNQAGGAHTHTWHPSGQWVSVNTSSGNGAEAVDVRATAPTMIRRIPSGVGASAHDSFFSQDGNTLFVAGLGSTRIVNVSDIFNSNATLIATIPNTPTASQNPDGQTIAISHQSDTTADGRILVITDERGGGTSNTSCNQSGSGLVGGAHVWALTEIPGVTKTIGATLSNPLKIGTWLYPTQTPVAPDTIGRPERGCTIHVFRLGGNGGGSPGPLAPGFDGVSRLPINQFVTAHYGAGTWWVDISVPPSSTDGIAEDARTTWGNTLGFIIMPGADTWSAKEYKGFIYTGDMGRGFDVFGFVGGPPTAVTVSSFRAATLSHGVRLRWRTASETRALGFNIYRSAGVKLTKVNRQLVPSKGGAGAAYAVVDRTKARGRVTYRLELVGLDGSRAWLAATAAGAQ
jgi:hypothetical protein